MIFTHPLFKLHFSIFLFGFTGVLGKLINLSEGYLVWYRMGLTTLGYLIWLAYQKKLYFLSYRAIVRLTIGGLILVFHWLTFYACIKYSTVSVALVCFSTGPLFTAVLEPLLVTGKKISRLEILLSLLITLGAYLIYSFQAFYTLGITLGLISALFNALYGIYNKSLLQNYEESTINFYEIGCGFAVLTLLLPLYTLYLHPSALSLFPSFSDGIYLLILSWLCTNFAYNLSMSALKQISPFHMMIALNLESIYGIVWAFYFFGEHKEINVGFIIGTLILFSSVFMLPLLKKLPLFRA
ncbi:MAG: DMT family transporter [Bacteroidia bacterium]|nr:DMT family transporter [Bacteroidia bacterium]MDW8157710.1 DMT family transporter [Bacteroidia bacterium]